MNVKMFSWLVVLLSFCSYSALGDEATKEQRSTVSQLKYQATQDIISATIQYLRPSSTMSTDSFWKKIEAAEARMATEASVAAKEVVEEDTVMAIPGDRDLTSKELIMSGQYVFEMHYDKGKDYFKKQFYNLRKIIESSGDKLEIKKIIVYKLPKQDYKGSVVIVGLPDQFEDVGVEIRNIKQEDEEKPQ